MPGALIFYAVFTAAYALINWLVFSQAASALELTGPVRKAVKTWFWVMVFSPAAYVLIGGEIGVYAFVTYVWLGLVFYLFLGSVLLVVFKRLGGKALAKPAFLAILAASVVLSGWGLIEARRPKVRELTVTTAKLPAGVDEVRILLISDLHLYSVEARARLERILEVIEPLDYDLFLSTGDLIETGIHREDWRPVAAMLAAVKPRLGKYAIAGNHEYYADRYAGADVSGAFHKAAGFVLLRQQAVAPGGVIQLIGLDDYGHGEPSQEIVAAEKRLLAAQDGDLPLVLLKHRPEVLPSTLGKFDLQLSGHTHGGQIWPFTYLVAWRYPYLQGLYELAEGSRIFTTVGAGGWGPPMRVFVPPEAVLIRLVRG